ncbi:MAG: AraC family transcriptional regulator [Ruminiclostridium sp.]
MPLSDISTLVGFDDQSYFTKVFKNEVGITPGKFRATRGQG